MQITYKMQERHLHEQYIAGLIDPLDNKYCMCGNMLGERKGLSGFSNYWPELTYTSKELRAIEQALLMGVINTLQMESNVWLSLSDMMRHKDYDEAVFNGMVEGLKVLYNIHRDRFGEIIDDNVCFEKKQLETVPAL